MKIAIDGPAGAGKSTIARNVAQRLGYLYIDTGAMYRALTYHVLQENILPSDAARVYEAVLDCELRLLPDQDGSGNQVWLGNVDVTNSIRLPIVSENVSAVSAHKQVRELMVALQRQMAKQGDVVMDGRDIGTTVMPDAELKIFLKASVDERARRRSLELIRQGCPVNLVELKEQIQKRDFLDSTRAVSPLRKAEDAIEIDTTSLTVGEVVEIVLTMVQRRAAHV